MINIFINNTNEYIFNGGQAVRTLNKSVSIPLIKNINDICYCKYECEHVDKVFYHEDNSDYKNDKTSLLYRKILSSDTISFFLLKNNEEIKEMNDNQVGIYYNGFTAQPNYVGYLIDWNKIYDNYGTGIYQIKTSYSIAGNTGDIFTNKYQLLRYSDEAANKTVRIETYMNGNIIGSEFDFTDLIPGGWYQSVRINGKLTDKTPVLEQDNYINSNYTIEQIQDKIITEYTLTARDIPVNIANELFYQNILSDRIFITDYNIFNHEIYRKLDLIPFNNEDVIYRNKNRNVTHTWKFKEKKEDNIKTNY